MRLAPVTLQPVTLQGALVRLEPLDLSHIPALAEIAAHDRSGYDLTNVPAGESATRAYVESALDDWTRGSALPLITLGARTGEALGSTRFLNAERWNWQHRSGELDAVEIGATWLIPQARGSGVNTEAKLLMLKHAFETWQVRRVTLKTDARNTTSRAAIERLGAHLDGLLRAHVPAADGGVRDSAMYSILQGEWPGVRTRLERLLTPYTPS